MDKPFDKLYVLLDEYDDAKLPTQTFRYYYFTHKKALRAARDAILCTAHTLRFKYPEPIVEPVGYRYETAHGMQKADTIGYALFTADHRPIETITIQLIIPENPKELS